MTDKYVIGVDPDSACVPTALYKNGKLINLYSHSLLEFHFMIVELFSGYEFGCDPIIELHIENVKANNAVFIKPQKMTQKLIAEAKARGRTLGMCQQAQSEVERVAKYHGIKIVHHKISKAWKTQNPLFEKVTDWKGRSNEDTRSAAYMGFLGV